MRLGIDKRWFVMPAAPFISRNFYFALPAFLLGFAIVLLTMFLFSINVDANLLPLLVIAWILWAIAFVFAYFEPDWLSPAWYRWLKRKHGDILPYLAQEAHRLGRQEWLSRVQTQEDLERWVKDFRRRHNR